MDGNLLIVKNFLLFTVTSKYLRPISSLNLPYVFVMEEVDGGEISSISRI